MNVELEAVSGDRIQPAKDVRDDDRHQDDVFGHGLAKVVSRLSRRTRVDP